MGASASVSATRASSAAPASASASGARATPVVSGLPAYMSVVDAGANAGAARGRIEALQQQEQTDDRSVAEDLADRIGQDDARETMQAEDARQAARSATAQQGRQTARDIAQAGSEAMSRSSQPEDPMSHAGAGDGLVTADGMSMSSDDEQVSRADDGTQSGTAAGSPRGGGAGGGAGAQARGAAAGGAGSQQASGGAAAAAPGAVPGAATGPQAAAGATGGAASGPLAEDVPRAASPETPDTGAGALDTGDLVLIDVELAEHQRWAAAESVVGEASSMQRAEFIAETAGSGFVGGVASGAQMGLELGLISRAVPQLGAIIGGSQALDGLLTRDWAATEATIGKFGEGSDIYETLANTLASVSTIITIANNALDYIGGIVGVIEVVAIGVAAGAGVLAFFTFGATAGIAVEAGELADLCEEIREGIGAITKVLNEINNEVLNPCILLFRALHEFTSAADPREIESQGHDLSGAAGEIGGALGGWIGGQAAHIGAHPPPHEGEGTQQRPPHETPPAAEGEGPVVHFEEPPTPAAPLETPATPAALPAPSAEPAAPAATASSTATPTMEAPTTRPSVAEIEASPGFNAKDPQQGASGGGGRRRGGGSRRSGRPPDPEDVEVDPIRAGVAQDLEEVQQLASGSTLGQPELGQIPGPPGRYLRPGRLAHPAEPAQDGRPARPARPAIPGERDPGSFQMPPRVAQSMRRRARSGARRALREAVESGIDTERTAASRESLTPDRLLDLTDPERRAPDADEATRGTLSDVAREADRGVQSHHVEGIASSPHTGDSEENAEILDNQDHVWGPHEGDVSNPNPRRSREVPPGFQEMPTRKPPTPTERGYLRDIRRDIDDLPGTAAQREEGRRWIAAETARQAGQAAPARRQRTRRDTPLRISDAPTRGTEPLSPQQYEDAAAMAVEMGMPADQVHPAQGDTSYHPGYDALLIGADLNPLPASERPANLNNPANAALEPRAVIGHEVIGHREAALGGATRDEVWHEELQASARAALHTPGLSDEQRSLLLQDAAARRRFQARDGEIYIDTERYGPAAEASRGSGPGGDGEGGGDSEPSVIIDPSLYEPADSTPQPQAAEEPATPRASEPEPGGGAPGGARTSTPRSEEGLGGGHAPESPTLGHDVATLFMPHVLGGESTGPSYAEQQAAHRAEFTADNQPAAGVERVNPHYGSPPGTPDQVVALQNEILNLLAVRARAEAESQHEGERIDACEQNRAPISQTLSHTHSGLGAVRAHEQAVARHDAANQAQQQRQQESAQLTGGYQNRAAGMGVLDVPLAAWEGFTSLASHLPGSAGDRMSEMNAQARQMQAAFGQMGAHMLGADGEQPVRAAALGDDSARIDATSAQAQTSHEDLQTAANGAVGLQSANDATLAAAQQRQQQADQRSAALQSAADERQAAADSLAAQMQAWAQAHRDQRSQAIAETVARLQGEGRIVTETPPE